MVAWIAEKNSGNWMFPVTEGPITECAYCIMLLGGRVGGKADCSLKTIIRNHDGVPALPPTLPPFRYPCYWLVGYFHMCLPQGCQSISDSIHIFESFLLPEIGTGHCFHYNDPRHVCGPKILNNLECGTYRGRILRNESLFIHPFWLYSWQPLSANLKF